MWKYDEETPLSTTTRFFLRDPEASILKPIEEASSGESTKVIFSSNCFSSSRIGLIPSTLLFALNP